MNNFTFSGRLTKDPEIRYSNDGKCVARFDIAVNRRYKREGEADADFFNCVAFGKTAEVFEKCSVCKGVKLICESEVRNSNYTDRDGVKHYGTQVVVNSFEFAESKKSNNAPEPTPDKDGFMTVPDGIDEELPFN